MHNFFVTETSWFCCDKFSQILPYDLGFTLSLLVTPTFVYIIKKYFTNNKKGGGGVTTFSVMVNIMVPTSL